MKLPRKKITILGVILLVVIALVVASPHALYYFLDSRQSPKQQLNELAVRTTQETAIIMKDHPYKKEIYQKECINQGEGEFLAFGRDTIHCTYSMNVYAPLPAKELRNVIEGAGWKRKI